MGGDTSRLNDKEAATLAVDLIKRLSKQVGIPETFADFDIKESDLDSWITKAMDDPCLPGNPRNVSEQDMKQLYKKVI